MKIHFVYALGIENRLPFAPHTITTSVYDFLSSKFPTTYYDWDYRGVADVGPDDILIGHPHPDPDTIIRRTFREKQCKLKCTMHPFHTAIPEYNIGFTDLALQSDIVFAICGPYWVDTIDQTPFKSWKEKITRLDMAIDTNFWKYRKSKFNEVGNRSILYVGNGNPEKGPYYLLEIIKHLQDIEFKWIGRNPPHGLSELPNASIEPHHHFTPQELDNLCDKFDIFINPSLSDANPFTLGEFGLASGLIPICTPTSGYYNDDCFINIPNDDAKSSAMIIRNILQLPSDELRKISTRNRQVCIDKYNWNNFLNTMWSAIDRVL